MVSVVNPVISKLLKAAAQPVMIGPPSTDKSKPNHSEPSALQSAEVKLPAGFINLKLVNGLAP